MVLGLTHSVPCALNPFPSHLSPVYFYSPLDGNSVSTEKPLTMHRCVLTEPWFSPLQMLSQLLFPPFVYVMSQCVSTHQAVVLIRSRAMLLSVGTIFVIQQKFNKLLIFSMNQGKMEFWKCGSILYFTYLFNNLCQIQNLATENRFRCFLSSLFHLSQKIQKIQNDVSLKYVMIKANIQLFFDYVYNAKHLHENIKISSPYNSKFNKYLALQRHIAWISQIT